MTQPTLFEQIGGEATLRRIIDRFVDRVFDDMMIGFMFRSADRQRVKDKEYEHAAALLGAGVRYTGRPLREAHAPHRIMGGQFARRLKILEETLDAFEVPDDVKARLLSANERLRPLITADAGSNCGSGELAP
jgi:hemoglobin